MLLRIVLIFLIAMAVLAMVGRLRLPGRKPKDPKAVTARKCPACGSYIIGKGPCACGEGKG